MKTDLSSAGIAPGVGLFSIKRVPLKSSRTPDTLVILLCTAMFVSGSEVICTSVHVVRTRDTCTRERGFES